MSGAKSLLDAVHAELLVDVQQIAQKVDGLKSDLPGITAEVTASAEAVKAASARAVSDFEAMGHALMEVLKRKVAEERVAAGKSNVEAAAATKSALEQFTKYMWLLTALGVVNIALLILLLSRLL